MLIRALVLALAAIVLDGCVSRPPVQSKRDVLWQIASRCMDVAGRDYCSACPAPIVGTCADADTCQESTQVWAHTPGFVAIRDLKMCGCPVGFVHGLAMPRAKVSGVEDPQRSERIWAFAWAAARARIPNEPEIALVVNPQMQRTQDQLHVHLVRLLPDARARLADRSPLKTRQLDQVWELAARRAASTGLLHYGVLVARDTQAPDGFLVVVQPDNPEDEFTAADCRGPS